MVERGGIGRDTATRERGKDMIREFVSQLLRGAHSHVSRDVRSDDQRAYRTDRHLLSLQLNEIIAQPPVPKIGRGPGVD